MIPTVRSDGAGFASAADHSRPETIKLLWGERNARRFASLLASTGATHLVEFSDHPLKIRPHRCLKAVWVSPTTKGAAPDDAVRVRVFEVLNDAAKGPGPS